MSYFRGWREAALIWITIVLGLASGALLGFVLGRGDVCFNSAFRGLLATHGDRSLFRAYLLAVLIQVPVLALLMAFGVISPYIPPFQPVANVVGGVIFGIGMVVAVSCISGLFTKLAAGMLGGSVGIAGWAAGDILTGVGPLAPLREALQGTSPSGVPATLPAILGPLAIPVLLLAAAAIGWWLWRGASRTEGENQDRKYWDWRRTGISLGIVTLAGWLIAKLAGQNYAYGSVGAASWLVSAASGQPSDIPWQTLILLGLIPGAAFAAFLSRTVWIRGEEAIRYVQLAIGGFLLGAGASIAGGCTLGHVLVGVPLLSLGSLTSLVAMIGGVWLAAGLAGRYRAAARQPRPAPAGLA